MILELTLPPDVAKKVESAAEKKQLTPSAYVLELLEKQFEEQERGLAAAALLQSWIDQGDTVEQGETFDYLTKSLDQDRPSDRPLFPKELKGVSW
jgi:site-specific recombinase